MADEVGKSGEEGMTFFSSPLHGRLIDER